MAYDGALSDRPWTLSPTRPHEVASWLNQIEVASWLNQIEIYFSILQRKALTPNDFEDLDALAARITAFEEHYRQIAQPFEWTFTRAKLDALLARLAGREPHLRLAA